MKYKIGDKLIVTKGKNRNKIAFLKKYKLKYLFLKKNNKNIKISLSNVKIY